MLDSPWLSQCKVLTRMLCLRTSDREVAVVHLIDDIVLQGPQYMPVVRPPLGVSVTHVHDNPFLSIHCHRLGEDTRRRLSIDNKLVGLPFLVTFQGCRPDAVRPQSHHRTVVIDHHHTLGISGSKQLENGLAGRVGHLVEVKHLQAGLARGH